MVEQVHTYISEISQAKAEQTLDLIEFDASAGFVQGTRRYRLKPIEDLYMIAEYKVQLGRRHIQAASFVPRNEVTLIPEGSKWMSKKIKATVQLGSVTLNKVTIAPEMATRIDPAAQLIALGST
jgi:hypothetical protein